MTVEQKIYTFVSMPVSQEAYEKIRNFCEDHELHGIPERENMCLDIFAFRGVHNDLIIPAEKPFKLSLLNSAILLTDGVMFYSGEGSVQQKLDMTFEADGIQAHRLKYFEQYSKEEEQRKRIGDWIDPADDLFLVLSTEFERQVDLVEANRLLVALIDYLDNTLVFNEQHLRYLTEEQIQKVYDGLDPDQ